MKLRQKTQEKKTRNALLAAFLGDQRQAACTQMACVPVTSPGGSTETGSGPQELWARRLAEPQPLSVLKKVWPLHL